MNSKAKTLHLAKGIPCAQYFSVTAALIPIFLFLFCTGIQAQNRDVVKFGTDVMIEEGMHVRDAVVIMGDITVDGPVARDVVVIGGSVILTNKASVGRNVVAISGSVERGEDSDVGGNISEINIPGLYTILSAFSGDNWREPFLGFSIWPILCFIGFLTLALLITAFAPGFIHSIGSNMEMKPVRSGLMGIMGFLLIVPIGILLAISIIGLVLIPVEMIAVSAGLLVGYVGVAGLAGRKMIAALKRRPASPIWETFWGMIILGIIGIIPILGWIINALAAALGFGAVWLALLGLGKAVTSDR